MGYPVPMASASYSYEYIADDKFSAALEKMAKAQDALNRSVKRGQKAAEEGQGSYEKMAAAIERVSQALARSAVNAAAFADETRASAKAAGRLGDETQRVSRASRDHAANVERGYSFLKSSAAAALDLFKHLESASGVKGFSKQLEGVEGMTDKLIDLQNALNVSDAKFEQLAGKNGARIFEAAKASGLSASEIAAAVKSTQAATSTGEELLANPEILRNAAMFTKASGGKLEEMTTASAIMGQQFKMTAAQKADVAGITYMQALQGSLEASSMPKFAKGAAPYIAATGKEGDAGYREFMAINNIVKDKSGLLGEEGAATTATLSLSLMDALNTEKKRKAIEKAMGGRVTDDKGKVSFGLMYERMHAAGKGLDREQAQKAIAGDDVALDKVGDSSAFMKAISNEVRDRSTRRALIALMVSSQTDYGTDKDLRRLTNVSAKDGQAAIVQAAGRWTERSATTRRQLTEDQQLQVAMGTYGDSEAVAERERAHKKGGDFAAANPWLASAEEMPYIGDALKYGRMLFQVGGTALDQAPAGGRPMAAEKAGALAAMAFAEGAKSQDPALYEAGRQTAAGVERGYVDKAEIHSPSRMMERLGRMSAEGLEVGYSRQVAPVASASRGRSTSVSFGDINVTVPGGTSDDMAQQIATAVRMELETMALEAGA